MIPYKASKPLLALVLYYFAKMADAYAVVDISKDSFAEKECQLTIMPWWRTATLALMNLRSQNTFDDFIEVYCANYVQCYAKGMKSFA